MQNDMFSQQSDILTLYPMVDAKVSFAPQFLDPQEAEGFFSLLLRSLRWRQDHIKLYGKSVKIPRLQAWYGDPKATYRYSGLDMHPNPWTESLLTLKKRCEAVCGTTFNSVLANYYRNGQDSMGWHSDDEPELGEKPIIASLSLGESRDFDFRHKQTKETHRIALGNGSLLVMAGATQQHWQHGISKRKRPLHGRINLTFRTILTSSQGYKKV